MPHRIVLYDMTLFVTTHFFPIVVSRSKCGEMGLKSALSKDGLLYKLTSASHETMVSRNTLHHAC